MQDFDANIKIFKDFELLNQTNFKAIQSPGIEVKPTKFRDFLD